MKLKQRDEIALRLLQSIINERGIGSRSVNNDSIEYAFVFADQFLEKIKTQTENEKIDFSKTNIA